MKTLTQVLIKLGKKVLLKFNLIWRKNSSNFLSILLLDVNFKFLFDQVIIDLKNETIRQKDIHIKINPFIIVQIN